MTKLTKRQTEILTLIETQLNTTGSPPTRSEIAKIMGFKSPNAAEDHLRALARKGVIELIPSTSRGIRLIQHTGIPIIHRITIGQPVLCEHNIKTSCRLNKDLFQPTVDFLKQVNSSQFKTWGLLEQDYLAIHQVDSTYIPQKGNFLIVREDNELIIKAITSDMDIMNIRGIIEGVAVGVIRPLLAPLV